MFFSRTGSQENVQFFNSQQLERLNKQLQQVEDCSVVDLYIDEVLACNRVVVVTHRGQFGSGEQRDWGN